jgi:hypothetical protein
MDVYFQTPKNKYANDIRTTSNIMPKIRGYILTILTIRILALTELQASPVEESKGKGASWLQSRIHHIHITIFTII